MKLLLDPNYRSGGSGGSQSDSSSVHSSPSKYSSNLRRVSEHILSTGSHSKSNRSISLGENSNDKQMAILDEATQRHNKKSELRRGRVVDKNHPLVKAGGRKRNADDIEDLLDPDEDGKENTETNNIMMLPTTSVTPTSSSMEQPSSSSRLSTSSKVRDRRLRRRHTVGGTKDFADFEMPGEGQTTDLETSIMMDDFLEADDTEAAVQFPMVQVFNSSQYHHSVMMNVDRSLGQWIRRQQKVGKSSPDLSLVGRRLSLPDSVLATAVSTFYPFTSLLESQV
jgi:hypothetical protein